MPEATHQVSMSFRKPVLRPGEGMMVIASPRLCARISVVLSLLGVLGVSLGLGYITTPWGRSNAWAEFWATAVTLVFVLGVITLLILAVYPAWSFRVWVYPLEGVARRRRYWCGLPVSSWWYEIGPTDAGFEVRQVSILVEDTSTSGGVAVLGCLLILAGPLGLLLGLLLPKKRSPLKAVRMYALASRRRDPGLNVVALFVREEDAKRACEVVRTVIGLVD